MVTWLERIVLLQMSPVLHSPLQKTFFTTNGAHTTTEPLPSYTHPITEDPFTTSAHSTAEGPLTTNEPS